MPCCSLQKKNSNGKKIKVAREVGLNRVLEFPMHLSGGPPCWDGAHKFVRGAKLSKNMADFVGW